MFLPERLQTHAQKTPDQIATIFENRQWSYAEFCEKMERIGAYFLRKGYEKEDIIALYALNSDVFLACYYGIQLAGLTVMPINTKLAEPEVAYILSHSEAKAFIVDDQLRNSIQIDSYAFQDVIYIGGENELEKIMNDACFNLPNVTLNPDDVAVVMYTSGTTGKPKGVMLTHQNILAVSKIWSEAMEMTAQDRMLISTPLFHCAASHVFVAPVFYKGGTIIVEQQFSVTTTVKMLQELKPTIFFGVPAMYIILLNLPEVQMMEVPSLRLFGYGAAPMPYELLRQLKTVFPNVKVQNLYGQTENSPAATTLKDEDALQKIGSVGKPLPQTQVIVVDEFGEPLPPGQVGEIIVKGPQVMKGYLKNAEETAMAIRDGWLHSGDLGRFDEDGFLFIVDRKKDMLIRGGENVYPIEIEEVLYQIQEVLEAAVVGIPHPIYGEAPKAFVVLKHGKTLTEKEVLNYCETQLAKYKVPVEVSFLSELPRNASGKVLKHALTKVES